MPIEPTDTWQDIADELVASQGFAENVLQEGLQDPLINQGYQHKDSLFLEVFR